VYDDNRQDRLKELNAQKKLLVDLVQELRMGADALVQKKIEKSLDEVSTIRSPTHSLVCCLAQWQSELSWT
jgi:hypothetical protein